MVSFPGLDRHRAGSLVQRQTPDAILEYYQSSYTVSNQQIEQYSHDGFIQLPAVLEGAALEYARSAVRAAVLLRKEADQRALAEKSQYEQSFLQCGYLCWDFPAVHDLVFAPRFAGIARDLLRVAHSRLWHDQALYKEPGGRATDVHQDCSYWPVDRPELTVTMWLALNPVDENNGCLFFYPGSHRGEAREYVDIFNNPHQPGFLAGRETVPVSLQPGDATFHCGLTWHGAHANRSSAMREGMTVIYLADGVRFDDSDERNATHKSCAGLAAGALIDTQFTPVLA